MKKEKCSAELERYCKFCEKAASLSDPDVMLCRKYGIVSAAHICRRFTYDPLKREPKIKQAPEKLEYVEI